MSSDNSNSDLRLRIEVLKLMDNITRLRIILAILIFRKISLTKLSELLGRAKSTITHHIKKLETLGVIKSTRKEARGSIDAKFYELIPGFLEKSSIEQQQNITRKKNNHFSEAISNDILFFKVIKILFEQVILYYEAIFNKNKKSQAKSFNEFQDSHFKIPLEYDFWFLSENGYKAYIEMNEMYKSELKEIIRKENIEKKDSVRPYLVLNTFFPLLQIIEYDSELKEFRKFFQALE